MREVQGSIRSTVITSKPVKAHLEPLTGPMGVNPPRMLPPYPICLSHNVISALGQSFCSSLGTQLPAVMSSLQDHTTPSDGDSSVSTYLNPNTQCSQVTVQGFLTASVSVQKNIRERVRKELKSLHFHQGSTLGFVSPGMCALPISYLHIASAFQDTTALILDDRDDPPLALVSKTFRCARHVFSQESSSSVDVFACTAFLGHGYSTVFRFHPAILSRFNDKRPSDEYIEKYKNGIKAFGSMLTKARREGPLEEGLKSALAGYRSHMWKEAHLTWDRCVSEILPSNVEDGAWARIDQYAHSGQQRRLWQLWILDEDGDVFEVRDLEKPSKRASGMPDGVGWSW